MEGKPLRATAESHDRTVGVTELTEGATQRPDEVLAAGPESMCTGATGRGKSSVSMMHCSFPKLHTARYSDTCFLSLISIHFYFPLILSLLVSKHPVSFDFSFRY